MLEFIDKVLAEYGPWALLALSGWLVAFFVGREYLKMMDKVMAISHEQREALDKLVEQLSIKDLLDERLPPGNKES